MATTLEAKLIPVVKELVAKYKKQSDDLAKVKDDSINALILTEAKSRLKGIIAAKHITKDNIKFRYRQIEVNIGCDIEVEISLSDKLYDKIRDFENAGKEPLKQNCRKQSMLLDMTSRVGKMRNLAAYIRMNVGSTKDALKLTKAELSSLTRRYIEDLTAETTCRI